MVKLVWDPETGRVLGGSIVGYRTSEVIATVALCVRARLTVGALAETGAVNPRCPSRCSAVPSALRMRAWQATSPRPAWRSCVAAAVPHEWVTDGSLRAGSGKGSGTS